MRKKIMIAVDQSIHSRNAMAYAARMAETLKEIDFALFHIQPMISQYLVEEAVRNPRSKAELHRIYEKNRQASHLLLENCKAHLQSKGIDVNCIEIKTQPRQHGIAEDILTAAEVGSYDAVLVGRRGISGLQEMFMGSVTSNLLAGSQVIPVWVVDGRVSSDDVLVAVDGSAQSLRSVDHVAYIFSRISTARLQFLNIEPRLDDFCEMEASPGDTSALEEAMQASNKKYISDFSAKAMEILKKAEILPDQVSFATLKKQFFTGKAIIETAKKQGFGTVVIGKSGMGNNRHLGKVASYVIQKMSDAAVWMVS